MMTREEASEILSDEEISFLIRQFHGGKVALDLALSALRPVSREQVEKVWRASWNPVSEDWRNQIEGDKCSACGFEHYGSQFNFCPNCGAPMTDEAVEMVMERLEELRNDSL